MHAEMIPCPHCGAENSNRKQICHRCQAALVEKAKPVTPAYRTRKPNFESTRQVINRSDHVSQPLSDYLLGVSRGQRAQYYRQMHSLLNAGIPLGMSLSYATDNIAGSMRRRVKALSEFVLAGALLSEGMDSYPELFPTWEVSVVRAGEKAGSLPQVMQDIAETLEMEHQLLVRVRTATIHLKITAFAVFCVLLLLIMLGFFRRGSFDMNNMNGGVDIFAILARVGLLAGLVFTLIYSLQIGWRAYGRTRSGSKVVARLLPRLPLVGPVMHGFALVRFAKILSTLWHAGVSPVESLDLAARATGDTQLIRQISEMAPRISGGATMSTVLADTHFLPESALHLLQTGETSGNVAEALMKVAEYHAIEVESLSKSMPMKIQLLMYLILVPLVAWLLIAFYSRYIGALLAE